MNTVPRPTTSSVFRGWNWSSTCMTHPVNRLNCVANESPWMWNSGRTLTRTSSGREPPGRAQRPQARGEVGMRVHDALGPPGRARAVEHQARIVAVDRGLRETALRRVPGLAIGHQGAQLGQLGLERLDERPLLLPGHHDPRPAVLEEVPQLVGGGAGIQRQRDGRGVQRPQVGRQERQLVRGHDRHAVARLEPQPPHPRGAPACPRVELPVSQGAVLVGDRGPSRPRGDRRLQLVEEVPRSPAGPGGVGSVTASPPLPDRSCGAVLRGHHHNRGRRPTPLSLLDRRIAVNDSER